MTLVLSWLSMDAGTRRLIAAYFGICGRLLYILFAAFPSLVYVHYICLSRLYLLQILFRTLPGRRGPLYLVLNIYFFR